MRQQSATRPFLLLAGCVLAAALSACQGVDAPILINKSPPFGAGSAVLLPGGNYRLVTVRELPSGIFCSEPSPDWAVAFGRAIGGSLSTGIPGKATASASGNDNTTQTVTAMLGRTAGVVALRDGLYSACQAYANGVIGKDEYALILSQYGNLLVSLASGGAAAAAGTPGAPPTPGVAVNVSTAAATAAPRATTAAGAGGDAGDDPRVAEMQQQAIQAMLVACIAANDGTIAHGTRNLLLDRYCDGLMQAFGKALPMLLRPAWDSVPAQTAAARGRHP